MRETSQISGIPKIPKISLALDTSTRAGSVAVVRDDEVVALVAGDASRTHGERLPAEIERALQMSGVQLREVDLLVVSSGPGAFTGLRIGLAAIQGLAMVLEKAVVGVSALDTLAEVARDSLALAPDTAIASWMDAQRGEVFAAGYRAGVATADVVMEPMVGLPTEMLQALPFSPTEHVVFIGDGAVHYREPIAQAWPHARIVDPVPLLAPALARLGRQRAEAGKAGPPHALQPLYVRRPDAELDRERHAKV